MVFGSLGALAACTRPKAKGFSGYAFIANQEGGAVAAVDLEVFAVARHIHVDGAPTAVVAPPRRPKVYALTPGNGFIHEIRTDNLTFARKLQVAESAIMMRLSADGNALYVLCREPRRLVSVALDPMRVEWQLALPADPVDFDVAPDGSQLAISYGAVRSISFVDVARRQAFPLVGTSGEIGLVRFQYSEQLIAANLSERMLSIYHAASRRLIVNLPLAVRPDQMCFNADGGQLFVTGEGMDAVVVVYPSHIPQVGETVLGGHHPGAMAASTLPGYLFVANPSSGDVSILDIETRRVIAVTPVGTQPSYIAITPDDQYALILNQASGGDPDTECHPRSQRAAAMEKGSAVHADSGRLQAGKRGDSSDLVLPSRDHRKRFFTTVNRPGSIHNSQSRYCRRFGPQNSIAQRNLRPICGGEGGSFAVGPSALRTCQH
jgi:YVTN family beta-propeller protein